LSRRVLAILGLGDLEARVPASRTSSGTTVLAESLHDAARARVSIEQATGVIAEHFGLQIDDAARTLRAAADHRQEPVAMTASAIVGRTLAVADLVAHQPASARVVGDPAELPERRGE
jgi:hypothetical protein